MTHVQISSNERGSYTLLVDGHDLSMAALADSLSVTFPRDDPGLRARVTFTVAADTLDLDLPESVVTVALKQPQTSQAVTINRAVVHDPRRSAEAVLKAGQAK